MRKQCCQYCTYVVVESGGMLCRRFPPNISSLYPGGLPTFPGVESDNWCGEYKYKSEKEDKKINQDEQRGINDVITRYKDTFKERFGYDPSIDVKDRAAAKKLYKEHEFPVVCKIIKEFIYNPPDWNRDKKTYDLRFIPGVANKILARGSGVDGGGDVMLFLKSQAEHRHEDRWFEYVDYVKKSNKTITYVEWAK